VTARVIVAAIVLASPQLPAPTLQHFPVWRLEARSRTLQQQPSSAQRHERLFPPEELGLLEAPDRATWQKPDQIMDALKIADGARVADIGAGSGWFTIRLADRVGPNGAVYAEDVQTQMLQSIERRVSRAGFKNVQTVLGTPTNPNLPTGSLDVVLMVDSYQELEPANRVSFLRNLAAALKPNGRIGVVNYKPGRGGPGPDVRIDSKTVEDNAREAGLLVLGRENLPYQYLLVMGLPERYNSTR
jgi:SAM-dependent methyltransferase